ncbi:MAG TPA: hypothetical protein VGC12_01890 [Methyloradius sp.]
MKLANLLGAFAMCTCLSATLQVGITASHAEDVDTPAASQNPTVYITAIDPVRDVGYHVGDILNRTITLRVEKPYRILQTSLPLQGTEKKYRGQNQGLEVRSAVLTAEENKHDTIYKLELSYQVFTNSVVVKPSQLPPEYVKFGGNGRMFTVRIPNFPFRISPLTIYGSVKVEKDMSQFRGPLLLDSTLNRYALIACLVLFSAVVIGLFYIIGNRSWLPRMGGPFARAYRDLRKIKDNKDNTSAQKNTSKMIERLHLAFNQSIGNSVFTADEVIASKPQFVPIKDEITKFFALSRQVFFDSDTEHGIEQDLQIWLRQFCRRCRDCERGLS